MTTALSTRVSRALRPLLGRDPFVSFQNEMQELMSRFQSDWDGDWPILVTVPSVDLSETDDSLQVRMDVPGLRPEEIDVEVSGNTLRICGEHKEEHEEKGKTFHRRERSRQTISRSLFLPTAVQPDKICAECSNGVLTVTLPKVEAAQTRKIEVKNNGK